ncbi:uncharacterized protein LOC131637237 [Vicia villosa]|uniref:uncharacterized protein LOC131637237 n=1 Tax=Vicia villosa TaxID=3911 RepID=UPI00273B998C|nr:uncharacterized protein LOC131637237 [Vicia villosa]
MESDSTTNNVDHYYVARRRRRLILSSRRRSRHGVHTQCPIIPVHPSSSTIPNLHYVDDVIPNLSSGKNHSYGTPLTSSNHGLENSVHASMARKKRRITLSNKRTTPNNVDKENICLTGESVLTSIQTPSSDLRLPLTCNLSNFMHTAPSQRHAPQPISHKKPRLHWNSGNNLLASFNQTVPPICNTDQASTSKAPTNNHATPSNLTPTAHYSDDANSDSQDDLNICSGSDADEEVDNEPSVDSHLEEYSDVGDRAWECPSCHASMWYQERIGNTRHTTVPKFTRCCRSGKVVLPLLNDPPRALQHLLHNGSRADSKNYQTNIRTYNAMFSFTSPGMKFDNTVADGGGPPTLRLHG